MPSTTLVRGGRSEGFPRAAYFVPGRDGIGVWPDSEIVQAAAAAAASSVANTSKKHTFLSNVSFTIEA